VTPRRRWWWPTAFAPHVAQIEIAWLVEAGIRGVIVDLDNTLVATHQLQPGNDVTAWIVAATAHGIRVIMVTNNRTPWALEVARALGIACIPNARKPLPFGFRQALDALGLARTQVVVVGDQLFTDVLGAKALGLAVILVEPLAPADPPLTRFLRRVERVLLHGLPRL